MSTADIALIVNGVVKLAALGTVYALGRQVMARVRIVSPPARQQGAGEKAAPADDLSERRAS